MSIKDAFHTRLIGLTIGSDVKGEVVLSQRNSETWHLTADNLLCLSPMLPEEHFLYGLSVALEAIWSPR